MPRSLSEVHMWLVTKFGFFSVVRKPDDGPGMLTVRARVKSDLVALRDGYLPTLGSITSSEGTDYRFRARVAKAALAEAVGKIALDVDYANFKDEVAVRQGQGRATAYGRVWEALRGLQGPSGGQRARRGA